MALPPSWSWTILPSLAGLLLAVLGLSQGMKLWVPWAAGLVLHVALLWQVWVAYRWPYGQRPWRYAWGCFGLVLLLVGVRRTMLFLSPVWLAHPLYAYIDAWLALCFSGILWLFVWWLGQVFHVEVPQDTPSPATFAIDSHWTILEWSPQMAVLFGWRAEEVIGRQTLLETLILPEDRAMYRATMDDIVRSHVTDPPPPRTTLLTLRAKDGTYLRVELRVQRHHETDGWHFQAEVRQLLLL